MSIEFFIETLITQGADRIALRLLQLLNERSAVLPPTKQEPEEPISIKEASALLGVSRPTLHKWMAKGSIPFHRMGRRVFLFKTEVLASLETPKRLTGGAHTKGNRGFTRSSTSSQNQV